MQTASKVQYLNSDAASGNLEDAGLIASLNRVQAVIEFNLDGTVM